MTIKKRLIYIFLTLSLSLLQSSCTTTKHASCNSTDAVNVITSIADRIVDETTYDFIDPESGDVIKTITPENYHSRLKIRSPYNDWKYWNGVLGIAMLELYELTGDIKYKNFSINNMEFVFNNLEYFKKGFIKTNDKSIFDPWHYSFGLIFRRELLDDFGAEAANLIDVYNYSKNEDFLKYINIFADVIRNKVLRHADGTLIRDTPYKNTLWSDDLYMGIPLLARLSTITNDEFYINDAVFQTQSFHEKLFNNKTRLYHHCWNTATQEKGVAHWGRGNGWVMLAKVNLLQHMSADHPERDSIINLLKKQIDGALQYQDPQTGLWHQVIDKPDSYLETSCSAMFTYSIANAVNNGWISKKYSKSAIKGWKGLESTVNNGLVKGICKGTSIGENIEFYYERPTILNDIHGLGAVLLAGIEIENLKNSEK